MHVQCIQKVFRPLHFFCYDAAFCKKNFPHQSILNTPMMTKQKLNFRHFSKFIKREKIKYHVKKGEGV